MEPRTSPQFHALEAVTGRQQPGLLYNVISVQMLVVLTKSFA